MIIILKKQAEEAQINALKKEMTDQGLGIHESEGVNTRILGLVGDTSIVEDVYKRQAYYYSTYNAEDKNPVSTDKPKIMILGGGPNRIGQGIEFDYCCVDVYKRQFYMCDATSYL